MSIFCKGRLSILLLIRDTSTEERYPRFGNKLELTDLALHWVVMLIILLKTPWELSFKAIVVLVLSGRNAKFQYAE